MADESTTQSGQRNVNAQTVVGNITTGDTHIHQAALSFAQLHQLPSSPAHFTGRAYELDRLEPLLAQGGAVIAGVRGMGGVGKTALAIVLAHCVKDRYPDAQIFLDLQGASAQPMAAAAALARIITSFQPEAKLPDDEAQLQSIYLSLLHEKRALIVLDNAPQEVVLDRLTPPSGSALLVTSRFNVRLRGVQTVALDELPPDKARDYLLAVTERIGAHADKLARLCGYLPLALELVANALQVREELEPADYARRLERQPLRELDAVAAAFAVSYGLLNAEQQLRWRALAVFPNTFGQDAARVVWALDDADETLDALSALKGYSLIGYNTVTCRWRLHDLARLFADTLLDNVERNLLKLRHAEYYVEVAADADYWFAERKAKYQSIGWEIASQEWVNIKAAQGWAAALVNHDKKAAELCIAFSKLQYLPSEPHEIIFWEETAVTAARLLNQRKEEVGALLKLGSVYAGLDEMHIAIEIYEQVLLISSDINDRKNEAKALWKISLSLDTLNDRTQAIVCAEDALKILEEIEDPNAKEVQRRLAEWKRA